MTPGWWQWMEAVQQHAPNEGAFVTAMVWARRCWRWSGNLADRDRAQPAHLLELVELHPAPIKDQAVRQRLKALQAAGLLTRAKAHSRWSPDVFVPSLPDSNTGTGVPVLAVNTVSQSTVLGSNTGHDVPVLAVNTGSQTSQHRYLDEPPPSSTESPENPPRPRAHTHAREALADGGEVLDALLRAMDRRYGETSSRLAPGYRTKAATALSHLRTAGWQLDVLVDRLNAREWGTAASLGRALLTRIADLALEPVPKTAAQRHAERQADAVRTPCDHGDPNGCAGCFLCRRGSPDDEDVICQQCVPAVIGITQPTTHGGTP